LSLPPPLLDNAETSPKPSSGKSNDDSAPQKSPRGSRTPPIMRHVRKKSDSDPPDSIVPKSPRTLSLSTGSLPRPTITRTTEIGGIEPVVKIVDVPNNGSVSSPAVLSSSSETPVDGAEGWTPDTRAELLRRQEEELHQKEKQLKQKEKEAKDQKNKEEAKQLKQQLQELKLHEKEIKREQKEEKKHRKTVEINVEQWEKLTSADKAAAKAEGGLNVALRRKSVLLKEKIEYRRILRTSFRLVPSPQSFDVVLLMRLVLLNLQPRTCSDTASG
jgi:uncharacterized membrane protein